MQKGVDGFFVDNTDVYYNYPQESIYDGILTILDYMNHTGRKIMINGGDCFVKKYLTAEKNVLIDGVNQENVFFCCMIFFYKTVPAVDHDLSAGMVHIVQNRKDSVIDGFLRIVIVYIRVIDKKAVHTLLHQRVYSGSCTCLPFRS